MVESAGDFAAALKARLGGSVRDVARRSHFGKTTISELTSGKRLPHERQLARLLVTAVPPADAAEISDWQERRAAIESALADVRDRVDDVLALTASAHSDSTEMVAVEQSSAASHQTTETVPVHALREVPAEPPRSRRAVLGVCFVNVMVLLAALVVGDLVDSGRMIAGTVRCPDDLPVVGVYVKADESRSGWATRRRLESPDHVRFSFLLADGGPWLITAGCGGVPGGWANDTRALEVVDTRWQDWTCALPVPPDKSGVCEPVTPSG